MPKKGILRIIAAIVCVIIAIVMVLSGLLVAFM